MNNLKDDSILYINVISKEGNFKKVETYNKHDINKKLLANQPFKDKLYHVRWLQLLLYLSLLLNTILIIVTFISFITLH